MSAPFLTKSMVALFWNLGLEGIRFFISDGKEQAGQIRGGKGRREKGEKREETSHTMVADGGSAKMYPAIDPTSSSA